jgi:hypothetical protein
MKKIIVLLTLAGSMLYADAASAKCSCTAKKKIVKRHTVSAFTGYKKKKSTNTCSLTSNLKREDVGTFYGYREVRPLENTIIRETVREEVGVDPNSGIGRNSSDNYHGMVNNGSMGANGTFPNGTCEMWVNSLDDNSSRGEIMTTLHRCYK